MISYFLTAYADLVAALVAAGLAVLNLGVAIRGFMLHALIIAFQKKD